MTNEFSTRKENQVSNKFLLIRLNPARYVNDDLTNNGDGTYSITLSDFVISAVKENSTALTLVSGTPGAGEYSYDENTNILVVCPNAAPSSSNALVVYYYLFYTGEKYRVTYEDPEDSGTTLRSWEARIKQAPSVSQNLTSLISGGIFTVTGSNFTILNDNNDFQDFLTENDSFYQKGIEIWSCLDTTEHIQKIYKGKITGVSLNERDVSIKFDSDFSSLQSPAIMGDDPDEVYLTLADYASLDPNKDGRPIPMFFGSVSRYKTLHESVTNLNQAQKLEPTSLYEGHCTDFSTTISTTTNRDWSLGRTLSDGFMTDTFENVTVDNADANYTKYTVSSAEILKVHIGDTFKSTIAGPATIYSRVYYVDVDNDCFYATKQAGAANGDDLDMTGQSIVIVDENDAVYYLLWDRDYTVSDATTANGNKLRTVTLADNFEANHAGLTALDPTQHVVYYRVKPDITNGQHGSILKELLEAAGLTVDSASITAANTAFNVDANFSIPNYDEEDYKKYYDYVQDILKSTLGVIFIANDFEIEYVLLDAPSSTSDITDIQIIKNSFNISLEYQDIVSQIVAYNPHYSSIEATDDTSASPSASATSNKARYLHGINKTIRFVHVLENMTDKITELIAIKAERFANYKFSTVALNLNSEIGDDLRLNKTGILGGDSTKELTIIGISKTTNKATITASDLYNLT